MSPDIKDLVQSSNNVARVSVKDGQYTIQCLTRSSVETEKEDLKLAITSAFEILNAQIQYGGAYPGWIPNPISPIVLLMKDLYREINGEDPLVSACHAGLECGILGTNYPDMQMISFGPTIHGAHSPDEKVNIPSVNKFWHFLLETLKRLS
jgi:dipeptidase D